MIEKMQGQNMVLQKQSSGLFFGRGLNHAAKKRVSPKREVLPDPKYRETDVSKFINVVMLHGKKAVAGRYCLRGLLIYERNNRR